MKIQRGMQTLITKWAKKISKKYGADCLVDFEDNDRRSFFFKYDGFIYDCVYYSGEFYESSIGSFKKMFEGTGWTYDYEDASVIIVYKED